MDLMSAAALASLLSFVAFIIIMAWHVAPWLRSQDLATALVPLLWVQAFRYVALQIFSAQHSGFAVSADARNAIAYGDLTGAILALAAITALRYRRPVGILLTWLLAAETLVDLIMATLAGIREQLLAAAFGVTWLILTFYVPVLWVSLGAILWQLIARRREWI
jgi:hypothetical protein